MRYNASKSPLSKVQFFSKETNLIRAEISCDSRLSPNLTWRLETEGNPGPDLFTSEKQTKGKEKRDIIARQSSFFKKKNYSQMQYNEAQSLQCNI